MFPFIIIIVSGVFTGVKWRKVKKNFPEEKFPEGKWQEAIPTTYIKRKKFYFRNNSISLIVPFKGLQKYVFNDSAKILTILTSINKFFIPVFYRHAADPTFS